MVHITINGVRFILLATYKHCSSAMSYVKRLKRAYPEKYKDVKYVPLSFRWGVVVPDPVEVPGAD